MPHTELRKRGKDRHSSKPHEVKERIIELFGNIPKIELFAREKTDGWDCWGNEVESDVALFSYSSEANASSSAKAESLIGIHDRNRY